MTSTMPVYLDCDTGVDDAVALAYLLGSPLVELVGIGTVSGNTSAAQAARNTLDLLALEGRDDIPVAVGAHDHLARAYGGGAARVHGANGIGGVELTPAGREADPRTAVQLLLHLSHEYERRLHVLTIGPATNVALALRADPTLADRVAAVTVMGGAALVPGNIAPVAEANVFNDPEAAEVLLGADWDVTLVPLDVTMEHTLTDAHRGALLRSQRPLARALGEMLDHYLDFYVPVYGGRACALHDPLAAILAAGALTPTRALRVPVQVDSTEGPGRGQTIVDLRGQRASVRDHHDVRTRVVLDVDAPVTAHLMAVLIGEN